MSQNTSHAVMAQRAEAHDSLDFFPTPPWATRALCEHVINIRGFSVWEPACGDGAMARPLAEYAASVRASDVHDYGFGEVRDFLFPDDRDSPVDWIISNPPFRLGEQFILRALDFARYGVAMLVRSVFVESVGRYERLFRPRPPATVAQFVERVPMVKGRLDKNASTATSYCWIVWTHEPNLPAQLAPYRKTTMVWIPPCRAKLEKPTDWV